MPTSRSRSPHSLSRSRPPLIRAGDSTRHVARASFRNLVTVYDQLDGVPGPPSLASFTSAEFMASSSKPESSMSCEEIWSNKIQQFLHRPMFAILKELSASAATNHKATILVILTISLSIFITGLYTNYDSVDYLDTIWSPVQYHQMEQREWLYDKSGFGITEPRYLSATIHRNGENILDTHALQTIENVYEVIQTVEETPGFEELCANQTCATISVANFWENKDMIRNLSPNDILKALSQETFHDGTPTPIDEIFGHRKHDSNSTTLHEVKLLQIKFTLPQSNNDEEGEDDDGVYTLFEQQALNRILDLRKAYASGRSINELEVYCDASFQDEFNQSMKNDETLVVIALSVMTLFAIVSLSFIGKNNNSCNIIGLGAVMSVTLSIMTGYGLMFIIGIPFTFLSQALVVVLFGMGLMNSYVIYNSFDRTLSRKPILNRIDQTMKDIGISITVTSMATTVTFFVCGNISVAAISWMCWYAVTSILIDLLYQLTLFVAIIAIDNLLSKETPKESRHGHGSLIEEDEDEDEEEMPLKSGRMPHEPTLLQPSLKPDSSGLIPPALKQASSGLQTTFRQVSSGLMPPSMKPAVSGMTPVLNKPIVDSEMDRFMIWYAKQLHFTWVKLLIFGLCSALLVFCAMNVTSLNQDQSFSNLVPQTSYTHDYWEAFERYADHNSNVTFQVYFRNVNQSDSFVQKEMGSFVRSLTDSEDLAASLTHRFWLFDFKLFAFFNRVHHLPFSQQVEVFLNDPNYQRLHQDDIVFNDNGDITASRVSLTIPNVNEIDMSASFAMLQNQQRIARSQTINEDAATVLPFFVFGSNLHMWSSFYSVSVEDIIRAAIICGGISALFALIFIPHWSAVFFVSGFIAIVFVDLLGLLHLAGLDSNAASMVGIILSFGLLAYFTTHLLLRFFMFDGSSKYKVQEMLCGTGRSILIGAACMLLGVAIVTFFSTSPVFYSMFLTLAGMLILGLIHAFVLLPVVLLLIGPTSGSIYLEEAEVPEGLTMFWAKIC